MVGGRHSWGTTGTAYWGQVLHLPLQQQLDYLAEHVFVLSPLVGNPACKHHCNWIDWHSSSGNKEQHGSAQAWAAALKIHPLPILLVSAELAGSSPGFAWIYVRDIHSHTRAWGNHTLIAGPLGSMAGCMNSNVNFHSHSQVASCGIATCTQCLADVCHP